jgi:succinyl-diaminopimelate desuccinylase
LNVGTIQGGINVNSVPDEATIGIDIRTLPGMSHPTVLADLAHYLQHPHSAVELRTLVDAPAVHTAATDPWVRQVFELAGADGPAPEEASLAPYFTDAAVLKPALGDVPTVILGPGEPQQAHQTNEYAVVARIEEAAAIYQALIHRWCGHPGPGRRADPSHPPTSGDTP